MHAAGGLRVISATAQPNRRAERQLRGRAGRRGDPGETFSLFSCYDEYTMESSGLVRGVVDRSACMPQVPISTMQSQTRPADEAWSGVLQDFGQASGRQGSDGPQDATEAVRCSLLSDA